jgi:UDP-glucose 4-epimerase
MDDSGSNVCHLVDRLGGNVKISDSLSTGKKSNLESSMLNKNVLFKKCDIAQIPLISQIDKNSTIFHLAASSDVRESMINPKKYFENNTVATMNVLEAMRKKDATKIIFTSSSVVYGISNKINFENSQKTPFQYMV